MIQIQAQIEGAVAEIRSSFPECRIEAEPDGAGGAFVTVHDVPLGSPYEAILRYLISRAGCL